MPSALYEEQQTPNHFREQFSNRTDKSTLTRRDKQKGGRMPARPIGSWAMLHRRNSRPTGNPLLVKSSARGSCARF
jgi:hypothetical protein